MCLLGVNVLEDEGLAKETATELQRITKKLSLPFIFKASFDKANRSSIHSYRGVGMKKGLKILETIKSTLNVPIVTDVHELGQAATVGEVADLIQIPAFLCRQTDLLVEAAQVVEKTGGALHIKKGQFLAPWDCRNILEKVSQAAPSRPLAILCERGTSFGYNNLVVDVLGIPYMRSLGAPVTIDATHGVQLPGTGTGPGGEQSVAGGRREGVQSIAAAAIAVGADAVFLEFHPNPEKAKCDGPSCLPLQDGEKILSYLKKIHSAVSHDH